ncbi:MAG: glycosyltransferase [Thermoguttaceae bacterium]|nr:glycosyltransferase [Thermoguttaceae bacterium]
MSKKTIALLAHNLRGGGASALGKSVAENLAKLVPENKIVVTHLKGYGFETLAEIPNVELWETPFGGFATRYRAEKNIAARLASVDCDWAWWLGNLGIVYPSCRQSVYVRNAYAVNYPEKHWGNASLSFKLKRRADNIFVRRTLRRCDRAWVQTETMRTRLLETYRFLEPERVGICPVPPLFRDATIAPSEKTVETLRELAEKDAGKFRALYVSMINPHKNVERVIETFKRYRQELEGVVLYVTAKKGVGYQAELWKRVEAARLTDSIRFIGTFPQADVPALFQACDVSLFPTLLETVGHGHNDALYFGRPLIASDLDFAREICGDAAYFVDPFSPESMKNGLLALKNDPQLRAELVERGKKRLQTKAPTWEEILGGVLTAEGLL